MYSRWLAAAVLILLVVASATGRSAHAANLEQAAIDEVARAYWNAELFKGECSHLHFDPQIPLMVFSDRPTHRPALLGFALIAKIDPEEAARKSGGLEGLERRGVTEDSQISVDVSKYPFMAKAVDDSPIATWTPPYRYLLSFSNRLRYRDRTYLEAFIVGDRRSSGVRVLFEFDPSGRMLQSLRVPAACSPFVGSPAGF
jgi:hypothetical protein